MFDVQDLAAEEAQAAKRSFIRDFRAAAGMNHDQNNRKKDSKISKKFSGSF